jgi:hypothetical protein
MSIAYVREDPKEASISLSNRDYSPLLAGPDGLAIMFVFKTGSWPKKPIGNNSSSLHSDVIADSIWQLLR